MKFIHKFQQTREYLDKLKNMRDNMVHNVHIMTTINMKSVQLLSRYIIFHNFSCFLFL